MRFWNTLKNTLTGKPRSATEFIQKFIRDSKKSRLQLEIIRDNEILVQVDSLRFTPLWFKVFTVDKNKFQNGFVLLFTFERDAIKKINTYIDYKNSGIELIELDEMNGEAPIRTLAKFLTETDDAIYLGNEIKIIIDLIFKSNELDPQVIFNLQYISTK
jgi:hypothetical protein